MRQGEPWTTCPCIACHLAVHRRGNILFSAASRTMVGSQTSRLDFPAHGEPREWRWGIYTWKFSLGPFSPSSWDVINTISLPIPPRTAHLRLLQGTVHYRHTLRIQSAASCFGSEIYHFVFRAKHPRSSWWHALLLHFVAGLKYGTAISTCSSFLLLPSPHPLSPCLARTSVLSTSPLLKIVHIRKRAASSGTPPCSPNPQTNKRHTSMGISPQTKKTFS